MRCSYVYDAETGLYYLQSRYYNPTIGRFINADALVSTGQGLLGNNMFAYCNNNPVCFCDPSGTKAEIWPILFGEHDPGYIHRAVQLHIITTGLFEKELYLPGVGRVDIYDPDTHEIWEIKHGGSTTEMQRIREDKAFEQVNRYRENRKDWLQIGHAGAFTGEFVINCDRQSYLVYYETPSPGVILYYVFGQIDYEPYASYAYKTQKRESSVWAAALLPLALCAGNGGSSKATQVSFIPGGVIKYA